MWDQEMIKKEHEKLIEEAREKWKKALWQLEEADRQREKVSEEERQAWLEYQSLSLHTHL